VLRRIFERKKQKTRNLIIWDQIRNELGGISIVGWRSESCNTLRYNMALKILIYNCGIC
jgi:hypothetical protein